jgi:hypothetical protein
MTVRSRTFLRPDITKAFEDLQLVTEEERRRMLTQGLPPSVGTQPPRVVYITRISGSSAPALDGGVKNA